MRRPRPFRDGVILGMGSPITPEPPAVSVKRRPFLRACLAFATCLIGGCFYWNWDRGWTVSKLEGLIREEIPIGSDRHTVEAWFARHRLPCQWSPDPVVGGRGDKTFVEMAGLRTDDLGGVL